MESSESSINEYNNSENCLLSEGMTFTDYLSFENTVKDYGKKSGFSVRLNSAKYNTVTREIRWRDIVCSRSGLSNKDKKEKMQRSIEDSSSRNRSSQRCECPFIVRGIFNNDNNLWTIAKINLSHNHDLVPNNLKKFMERTIPEDAKQKILDLHAAGIEVTSIMSILKHDYPNTNPWLYDDIYNFVYNNSNGTGKEKIFDAQNFINLLEQKKNDDPEFSYIANIDPTTNELKSVIWMNGEQKMSYSRFNDIIVYDNTYKCNRFNMPFGIFTGINNYGQSTCFAGTLMDSETTDSFIWIFDQFLKLVNHHAPKVILTDNDAAMASAFDVTFKNYGTVHRLCIWHLTKNLTINLMSKLGNQWANFQKSFYSCLNELDEHKFVKKWKDLNECFTNSIQYLKNLEKIKEKWALCYNKGIFMADMSSTQRAESMNNLMKGYMSATTSLTSFLNAFDTALDARKQSAEFTKYKEYSTNIIYKTSSPYEKQASTVLTNYALIKTQQQLSLSYSYKCEELLRYFNFLIILNYILIFY
jgi:hypothetical protein